MACRAERGFIVVEYVANKNNGVTLPKNIRQVGDIDPDKRVYIEDYAFAFAKDLLPDSDEEGRVGLLYGKEIEQGEDTYIFIKGAMEVENASVFEGKVAFTEETWTGVNAIRGQYFSGLDIVGWFLVSSGMKPESNITLERTHIDSIGRYKLLLYINPDEGVQDFYTCFDAGLEPLDGYVVYFEKNDNMQLYMGSRRKRVRMTPVEDNVTKRYRQAMRESSGEPRAKRQLAVMYFLSAVLVILVLVIGVGRLSLPKQPDSGEEPSTGSSYVDNLPVSGTVAQLEDETLNIDYAGGEITTTAEATQPVTEVPTVTEAPTEEITQPPTEPETTAARRVHVVREGETLYGILMQEYGSLDKLQELLDVNGITDGGNSINIGDELLLP